MTIPIIDLADTTLVLANPAQWRTAQENQFPTWFQPRGYKDVDDFIKWRRPFFDPEARWNKNQEGRGTFLTWSLVPRSDPDTANILCDCETYLRPAIYLPPGETTPRDCTSYGIAAVYTNPAHRGKGYARHMLRLLHYLLAPPSAMPPFPKAWGEPPAVPAGVEMHDALFSVLYSGVGDQFYAKVTKGESEPGWIREHMTVRQWNFGDAEPAAQEEEGWIWLDRKSLLEMEGEAARRIRRDLATTGDGSKTRLAILPDPGCFEVHAVRYQVIPGARPSATYGLVLPGPKDARPFFTYSCKAYDNDDRDCPARMVIMYSTPDVPWSAVVAAARREGVTRVEMWGNYSWWDGEAGGAELLPDESMPCIAQYGLGGDDKIEWEFDEKYAWM